jgi:hypothetical protein
MRGTLISAWAAIAIALCSLCLAMYQGYEDRRYKRISVRPELNLCFYRTDEGAGWQFWNSGLGPAQIKWFEVTVDGIPKNNWSDVVNSFRSYESIKNLKYKFLYPYGTTKASAHSDQILWFGPGMPSRLAVDNYERVGMRICYCSLYDECWQTTIIGTEPITDCNTQPAIRFGFDKLIKY